MATVNATASGSRPQYASTSLYVGDLGPDVTETVLYEFFNSVGPVASIRVCRDANSRRSLGYAYINYHSISDAERAMDTLNYTPIKSRPCRIMWSQRDPTTRKAGAGNVFVKNLDKGVDNRALHDTFSLFGNILSCKVATDENGKSKGYGFVHFESDEYAQAAIEKVNGMKIGSKDVYVGPFHKRSERQSRRGELFTNLYVRSYPPTWTEETLRKVFGAFGEITSLWNTQDKQGRPYACINYKNVEEAKAAVQTLNNKRCTNDGVTDEKRDDASQTRTTTTTGGDANKITDTTGADGQPSDGEVYYLYVTRAQDKNERSSQLRAKFDQRNIQNKTKYEGVNLYIKNLSDNVDDAMLREMFERFGTITSAKVMRDEEGHSKGFGFVCFTTAEEATKAIAEMHLKVHEHKPLYVGLAEQKDRRQARLQHHFRGSHQRGAGGHGGQNPMAGYHQQQPSGNMFYGQPSMMPPPHHHAGGPPLVWPAAGFPAQPNVMWKQPAPMFGSANNVLPPLGPNGSIPPHMASMMFPPAAANPAGYRMAPTQNPPRQIRGPGAPMGDARGPAQPISSSAAMQKQVLGETLFPLVAKHEPTLAGKITGMMLDMDDEELRILIQSEADLKAKIEEALRVLHQAQHM
eukprot:Blabericola_migrator_1__416@NODE_10_length_25093_cov_104_131184_g7_i2_p4_GENE_NODE_10_length_25093_cov_104_131184_g7_i2NODE_10_length_25093_cov_104_131184_g7_i2_p4_ORF_typecomplete_len633_score106_20RRM_1/PF00076_22/3_6e19RRM_1/PF00076_22/1_2e19RRM_1/PF00076_22/1_1e12RRM_1/PF00076_22/4_5e20RRM_5/PF13893_6/3_8e06RRM_5/PF13893_6/4_6e06RRM_5/PF13893_6/0_00081RRM_5/PF13893_6/5_4e05PABP/PF00658_18/3_2e22RRM_7/PF16367_5/0_019RRM_7/PF16367_5/0_00027RRM_7/PF16367_5/0_047RRM_7/PF16367_5/0_055RRM_8/PF1183